MDFRSIVHALENSPKGQLKYETGWDESPNAITSLITVVQEKEIDKPNREIVERAFTSFYQKDRLSYSPKTSPTSRVSAARGRRSLPVSASVTKARNDASPFSPALLSSMINRKVEEGQFSQQSALVCQKRNVIVHSEPRITVQVQEVKDDLENADTSATSSPHDYGLDNSYRRRLLTPPTRIIHRKKSFDGSPIFKPSPSFSSSTQTQTHSSATSDATTVTPTRKPICNRKSKKYGINDEAIYENEVKVEEDLILESRVSPYSYIENCVAKYQEEQEKVIRAAGEARLLKQQETQRELEIRLAEEESIQLQVKREQEVALKQAWIQLERTNLEDLKLRQANRQKNEDKLQLERKAAAAAAAACRKAAQEAAMQEQLRQQKANEDELRRKEEANLQRERLLQEKVAEEKRLAEEQAAVAEESRKRAEEQRAPSDVVPELNGLILKDGLSRFAKTTELLRRYEEPIAHIDGKDPATKAFYIGAVKCINTPLNALADTNEGDIMAKVQHFSKLLSGEPVSGGGSMTTMFSCASVQNGELFVMKTFAFRFVKKSEADVTRGISTVQPLATVGAHLCKKFPVWAMLVQANLYKLCPFLVPFSYPQGDKSMQEYAKELGHDLSGTETAIQQTFLERLKGYCTLYALMILKFDNDGPFDIGVATSFFTIGGAWHIIATTMKLRKQNAEASS